MRFSTYTCCCVRCSSLSVLYLARNTLAVSALSRVARCLKLLSRSFSRTSSVFFISSCCALSPLVNCSSCRSSSRLRSSASRDASRLSRLGSLRSKSICFCSSFCLLFQSFSCGGAEWGARTAVTPHLELVLQRKLLSLLLEEELVLGVGLAHQHLLQFVLLLALLRVLALQVVDLRAVGLVVVPVHHRGKRRRVGDLQLQQLLLHLRCSLCSACSCSSVYCASARCSSMANEPSYSTGSVPLGTLASCFLVLHAASSGRAGAEITRRAPRTAPPAAGPSCGRPPPAPPAAPESPRRSAPLRAPRQCARARPARPH